MRGLSSKKNQKIREKLGSGWVGQAPTRIFFLGGKFCLFFVCCFHVSKIKINKKKVDVGVGG